MKKLTALILVLAMIFSFANSVFAATLSSVADVYELKADEQIAIDITVDEEVTAMNFSFEYKYDAEKFEYVSCTPSEACEKLGFTIVNSKRDPGTVKISKVDTTNNTFTIEAGTIATLVLKAKVDIADITETGLGIDVSSLAIQGKDGQQIPGNSANATVTVPTKPEEKPEEPVKIEINATLGLPANVPADKEFNGVLCVDNWNNEGGFKLIDFVVSIPRELSVMTVEPANALAGGKVSYNFDAETGTLRVVYFDANENKDITVSGSMPAELFNICFKSKQVSQSTACNVAVSGMSVKRNSDSEDENSMIVVNTEKASATVNVLTQNIGPVYSAVQLYQGDDIDLIPASKKAVAVAITGISAGVKLIYDDGTNVVDFLYSKEITKKTGINTYVALVDASIEMTEFIDKENFTVSDEEAGLITFGDINSDNIVNAQDALDAVNYWLRKSENPTDEQILTSNVNADSRLNTYDALGIVEAFVNGTDYAVVTKAAVLAPSARAAQ